MRAISQQFDGVMEAARSLLRLIRAMLFLAAAMVSSSAYAQNAEGTKGWFSFAGPNAQYYQTPQEACQAQWQYFNSNPLSRFIGAAPPGDTFWRRDCQWTNFGYLCPEETGGGISGCGTVVPVYVELHCDSGYSPTIANICQKNTDLVPERRSCSWNNGSQSNPTTPNPILLSTGSRTLQSSDFVSADGLFAIGRSYRSLPVGNSVGAQQLVRGLAGGWSFDFAYELQLRSFSGSPTSPDAKLTVLAPDGTGYDFVLQSNGSWVPDTSTGASYAPTDLKLEYVGTLPANLAAIQTGTSEWRLTDGEDTIWLFETFPRPNRTAYVVGRPTSRTARSGYSWTFTYAADSSLASIEDSFGREATFNWYQFYVTSLATPPPGASPYPEAVATIDLPDGTTLHYTYDPTPASSAPSTSTIARLLKVERLTATNTVIDSMAYHYEDSRLPTHVTGITDNRNVRIATYAYDARGRGVSSEGADGTQDYAVEWNENASELTRRVTNPLGKEAVFTYERFGSGAPQYRLVQIDGEASTNCPASVSSLTYGVDGFIATSIDEEGRTTSYVRDAKGRPTTIVDAVGTASARTTTISWDSTFNVPLTTVGPGLTETRTYGLTGQLASVTQTDTTNFTMPYSTYGRSHVWTYAWSSTGLLEAVDGPLPGTGDTISYTYSADGYLDTRTDQVGHTVSITSRNGRGDPLTSEDENGVETVLTYDGMGRPLTITVNPGAAQSHYVMTYDAVGKLTKMTMPGGGWTQYSYDDASRMIGTENDRGETQAFTYNDLDQLTSTVTQNAASATTFQQASAYDELGRLRQAIGAGSQTWTFAYDKVDNLTSTTDARSKKWSNGWDALNRVISETDPEAATVDYAYAPNDSLTRLTDARDLVTTRIVDGFGLTIFEHSPDRGDRTYWYDAADRLTQLLDAKGVTTQYSYDDADRMLSESFSGSSGENIAYSYDAVSGGNVGIGRLTGVTDASGSSAFVYDDQGRLTADKKIIDGQSYDLAYTYDNNGLVTSITYPSGHIVIYTRAADGKISAVTAKPSALGASTYIATAVDYAPLGPLTGLTFGNGLQLTRRYDQNYWLVANEVTDTSTSLLQLTYARDANGGLTGVTDGAATGRGASFSYTDASRLATSSGAWGDEQFAYDASGNRQQLTIENGATDFTEVAAVSNSSNRIDALYVDGGPLTSNPLYAVGDSYAYLYNARQRMAGVALNGTDIASYDYDYAGRRTISALLTGTPSSVHYIFAPDGRLLAEHDGSNGALLREYIWLDAMPLAMVGGSAGSPTYMFIHTGQIDEPLMMTDAVKAKVWDAAIDPWGKAIMLATVTEELDLRLPGQWHQGETGLSQNWMRDYDPVLGRYAQADPLGVEAGDNLYGYVANNPLNIIDPDGLQFILPVPRRLPGIPLPSPGRSQPDKNNNGISDWDEAGARSLRDSFNKLVDAVKDCFSKKCPPCRTVSGKIVPVGTIGYRFDKVPPSRPHYPFIGDHYNLLVANQNPNNCMCFWRPLKQASLTPPPGSIPVESFVN